MHLSVLLAVLGLFSAGHLQDAEVAQGCNLEKSGESHVFAGVSSWTANKLTASKPRAKSMPATPWEHEINHVQPTRW